jgi:hypothetical protein
VSIPRDLLETQIRAFGEHPFARFMLDNGKDYAVGPETYAGRRETQGQCYMNATLLALADDDLTYVEGQISMFGISIEHAWCVNADGVVIDPTLKPDKDVGDYFGVPFLTDYVRKACLKNGYYGLLNIMSARKTLPKLVELGLEDGQQWLIGGKRRKKA